MRSGPLGDTYCTGLWRKVLVKGLLWYSALDKEEISSEYIRPSWSWVAIDSGLVKWKSESNAVKELAIISKVHVEHKTLDDPYGHVKEGRLTITAAYHFLAASLEGVSQLMHVATTNFQRFIPQVFEEDEGGSQGFEGFQQQHIPCPGQHFAALQIVTGAGSETNEPFLELLLLESANDHASVDSEGENKVPYRRIGQVSLRKADNIDPEGRPNYFMIGPAEDAAWREVAGQE